MNKKSGPPKEFKEMMEQVLPEIADHIEMDHVTSKMANALMDVLRKDKTIQAGSEAITEVIEGGTNGQIMVSMAVSISAVVSQATKHEPEQAAYQIEAFCKLLKAVMNASHQADRKMAERKSKSD